MKKILAILFAVAILPLQAEFLAPPAFYYEYEEEVEPIAEAIPEPVVIQATPIQSPRNHQRAPAMAPHRATSNQVRSAGVRQSNPAAAPGRAVATRAPAVATPGTIRNNNVSRAATTQVVRAPTQQTANRSAVGTRPVSSRSAVTSRTMARTTNTTINQPGIAPTQAMAAVTPISAPMPIAATSAPRVGNDTDVSTARAVSLSGTAMSTGRSSVMRNSVATPSLFNATAQQATPTISDAEQLAAQTDFCRAQYMGCMDNFCNVLDDNQGRCSCSDSVKTYADAEKALHEATIALQQISVEIRYLGLSSDEVKSMFAQTAAETAMEQGSDNSKMRHTLDVIQTWLIDPSKLETNSDGLLATFDFDSLPDFSKGFDFTAFMGNNISSVKDKRGDALFTTASERCENILTDCRKQGVTMTDIKSFYMLEIDKQCVTYERQLTDENDNMRQTIRNATNILQQARLMVAQNKNRYDLRGCVSALDSCMQDEFVCGKDFNNCLDTTGKLFANGALIPGSTPAQDPHTAGSSDSNDMMKNWKYKNSDSADAHPFKIITNVTGNVTGMINSLFNHKTDVNVSQIGELLSKTDNDNLAKMLAMRIGYIDGAGRVQGMCSSVLNQCQRNTFDTNGSYRLDNEVVREFLARTLMQIKARQDDIISSHAAQCRQEVLNCTSRNNLTKQNADTPARSCMQSITTCMSVLDVKATVGLGGICPTSGSTNEVLKYNNNNKWECSTAS